MFKIMYLLKYNFYNKFIFLKYMQYQKVSRETKNIYLNIADWVG